MTHEKARDILLEGRGSHFDPVIIEAFLAVEDAFEEVSSAAIATVETEPTDSDEQVLVGADA